MDPAWVALSLTKHLGGKTLRALLQHFDHNLPAILAADVAALRQVPGVGPKIAQAIREIDVDTTARAIERWQEEGVRILTWDDAAYPRSLRGLEDAPPTLFVVGRLPDFRRRMAYAVVGTRQPTPQSCQITERISAELADRGHIVVSGLAAGIDTIAHMGALAVPTGSTVAVLGGGILNVYPPSNRELAQAINGRGALICEVSPDAEVGAPGLVARNRLITGLCEGLIVVETGVGGGAMHAARFAKIQNKRIYAVDNAASGNRQLIADGAAIISPEMEYLDLELS